MSTTASTSVAIPSTYTEESPTPKMPCVNAAIRAMQMGCLLVIPVFATAMIMFMAVMAVRCDDSGGFVMKRDGSVYCVSSSTFSATAGRETNGNASRLGSDVSSNGTVVMTITRVVLISVSVLIFSFTAWICVWYQRYGKTSDTPPASSPTPATSAGNPVALDTVLTVRVNDYFSKEDMERLLGPEHSAAPAV